MSGNRLSAIATSRWRPRPVRRRSSSASKMFSAAGYAPPATSALAAIEKCEARAVAPPTGRMAAHLLAASRRLDLDDLGAGLGQEQRRQWARQQSREVEDKQTFERPHRAFPYSDEQVASSPD